MNCIALFPNLQELLLVEWEPVDLSEYGHMHLSLAPVEEVDICVPNFGETAGDALPGMHAGGLYYDRVSQFKQIPENVGSCYFQEKLKLREKSFGSMARRLSPGSSAETAHFPKMELVHVVPGHLVSRLIVTRDRTWDKLQDEDARLSNGEPGPKPFPSDAFVDWEGTWRPGATKKPRKFQWEASVLKDGAGIERM